MSNSNVDLSFTDGELKLLERFEGEEKAKLAESILAKKYGIITTRIDKCESFASFIKDLALAVVNGADKIPAVIDSYNKLKEMELENQKVDQ